jgi:hypothetical protein
MPIEILKDRLHTKNGRVRRWIKYFNLETLRAEGAGKWNSDGGI